MLIQFIFSLVPNSFPYSYSERGTESVPVPANHVNAESRSWLLTFLSAFLIYQGNCLINMVDTGSKTMFGPVSLDRKTFPEQQEV